MYKSRTIKGCNVEYNDDYILFSTSHERVIKFYLVLFGNYAKIIFLRMIIPCSKDFEALKPIQWTIFYIAPNH